MEPIRILVADDHRFYREGVRALLAHEPSLQIVGEATTGDEVVERAAELAPDIVLMDLQMPGQSGIEATRQILLAQPEIAILVITMFDDDASVFAAMRAGARGYLLKDADQEELLRAIRGVRSGEAIFGPAIARRMMHFFGQPPQAAPANRDHVTVIFPELTDREREVLTLIAQGLNNTAIANRLTLSLKTVQNHISTIFSKLQVADRAQAIVRARDAGLK